MNIEVLKRVLKEAQRDERHRTVAETRYWCDQYKAIAEQALAAPALDYAWPTVADYEKDVGFEVNDAFKMAWAMARTTNALFAQMEKNA